MVTEAQISTEAICEAMQEAGYDCEPFMVYLSNDHVPLAEWQDYTDQFEDAYAGFFNSRTEFAQNYVDSTGLLTSRHYEGVPNIEILIGYFDLDSFGRDLMHDYWETDGYYFRAY